MGSPAGGGDTHSKTDGTLEEKTCLSTTKQRREWPAYQTTDGKILTTRRAQREVEQKDTEQTGLKLSKMALITRLQAYVSESYVSYKGFVHGSMPVF